MRYRPMDRDPDDPRFGRFIPDDWHHVERYPIGALADEERPSQVPVVIGVNWYREFDKPERDEKSGEFFVAKGGAKTLTSVRGGHCVCLEPGDAPDKDASYQFYNQGQEGACVGFGWSRCMTLLNGAQDYTARWLWDRAKERDEWTETKPGDNNGTSVRAAGEVLVALGHVGWKKQYAHDEWQAREKYQPNVDDGLKVFRWAKDVADVHAALGNKRADELGAV